MVLARSEHASIREMKPEEVESNLFSYHLNGLVGEGYITKTGRGVYTLTPKGHKLIGSFSTATNTQQENIKTVVMLYGKTHDGHYLFFQWSRQPYINRVTLLHDRMPLGKSLENGIQDATFDKLGMELKPRYMTSVLIKITHDGELVSHMNALVYSVNVENIELPYQSRNGKAFLASLEDLDNKMEGLDELVEALSTQSQQKEFYLTY